MEVFNQLKNNFYVIFIGFFYHFFAVIVITIAALYVFNRLSILSILLIVVLIDHVFTAKNLFNKLTETEKYIETMNKVKKYIETK